MMLTRSDIARLSCLMLLAACARHDQPATRDTSPVAPTATHRDSAPATPPAPDTAADELPFDPSTDTVKHVVDDGGSPTKVPLLRRPELLAQLPATVRDTLVARKCRVPQWAGDTTANVLRGEFYEVGAKGWAVWCVDERGGNSRIVLFRDGHAAPDELEPFGSPTYGGVRFHPYDPNEPSFERYGCIADISTTPVGSDWHHTLADPDSVTAAERAVPPHEGILDGDCEGTSNIHYWTGKRWVLLSGAD